MVVPAAMVELDEAHVALRETAGKETVGGEGSGLPGLVAVELEGAFRLVAEVGDVRDGLLHVEGHLVLRDAGFEGGVAGCFELNLVQFTDAVEDFAAVGAIDALGTVEIKDGILVGAEADSIVLAGKKAAAPEARDER